MALATVTGNVYVAPEDGWKQIVAPATTGINFLEVRLFPCNHGVYLYLGTSAPTELFEPTGMKLDDTAFHMETITGAGVGAWVRCLTPSWGGGKNSDGQKQRVDYVATTS